MKAFGNNDKSKTGNINQQYLCDFGFVPTIPGKQNLYQQHVHQYKAWLLGPLHTLIVLLRCISFVNSSFS